jgi:hypothetical protein
MRADKRLQAHHLVCEILSSVDLSEGELGWDKIQTSFTAILDLAEAVLEDNPELEVPKATNLPTTPKIQLGFSLGIVDPLYEVCARCQDPALRRRALDLLARHHRQDCMWNSWSAWKVGSYLMGLGEESSTSPPVVADEISPGNRISEAWFDFSHVASTGDESIGRLMYKHVSTQHSPRDTLSPGLIAGAPGQLSGQDIDFAHAMLGSVFLTSSVEWVSPTGFESKLAIQPEYLSLSS